MVEERAEGRPKELLAVAAVVAVGTFGGAGELKRVGGRVAEWEGRPTREARRLMLLRLWAAEPGCSVCCRGSWWGAQAEAERDRNPVD